MAGNFRKEVAMFTSRFASEQTDLLCDALIALESREDAYRLLEDLCTIQEVQALSQRIAVARMLRGGATYHEVAKETGASSATISRVSRCLGYGAEGYTRALNKMAETQTGGHA
jgi:TrpR-related protein YerC/YecD